MEPAPEPAGHAPSAFPVGGRVSLGPAGAASPGAGGRAGAARRRLGRLRQPHLGAAADAGLCGAIAAGGSGLGRAHALGPGHGKTIVASYLVGSQGTAWHAALLGLTVTITHTSSVIAVGLVTLLAAPLLPAEDLYIWLSVTSGLLVVGVAAALFATRLRSIRRGDAFFSARPRKRTHGRPHVHAPGQQIHGHGHSHEAGGPGLRGLIALGISGGLLSCPTALIVMLGAIALDRTVYGLALVLAFGVGLSIVLTGIGLVLVYANRFLSAPDRFGFLKRSPVRRAMVAAPLLGSLVMFVAGLVITGRALSGVL
ncbi:MAG: high frequency lysogenization protein HflD [Dehalococcoidia bacterium]|nr:high frequency lysogenization protein HflD [Dehalococcoidia bacterium]